MQRQLHRDEQEVEIKKNQVEILKSECSRLEDEVSAMVERIHTAEELLQQKLRSQTKDESEEMLVELQIEVTNQNIGLVDLRMRSTQAKIRLSSSQYDLCQAVKSISTKKQLLVRLSL